MVTLKTFNGPLDNLFSSGYVSFKTELGIEGLVKQSKSRVDFLALASVNPGKGNFKKFLTAIKSEYKAIYIWEIMNGRLEKMLLKSGFEECSEITVDSISKGVKFVKN